MQKLLLVFLLLGWQCGLAQIVPNSNQVFQFAPAYNPAFTGIEEFTSLKLGYRKQWVSFPDAPQYLNLVLTKRLNQPVDMVHNALFVPNPLRHEQIPNRKRIINSVGVTLVNQKYGIFEELDIGIIYSFQYPVSKKAYFSVGLSPSYTNSKSQFDKIITKSPDQYIDYLKTQSGSSSILSLRAGILYYSPKLYVHASLLQAWRSVLSESVLDQGYNMIAAAGIGYSIDLTSKMKLKPSLSILVDEYNELVNDYSAKLYFGEQIWGGVTYRDSGFGVITLGYEFNHILGVSYSYELATGDLKGASNGSHEIVIGFKLDNQTRKTPYLW